MDFNISYLVQWIQSRFFVLGGAGDRVQVFTHPRQVFYHWATTSAPQISSLHVILKHYSWDILHSFYTQSSKSGVQFTFLAHLKRKSHTPRVQSVRVWLPSRTILGSAREGMIASDTEERQGIREADSWGVCVSELVSWGSVLSSTVYRTEMACLSSQYFEFPMSRLYVHISHHEPVWAMEFLTMNLSYGAKEALVCWMTQWKKIIDRYI